MNIFYLSKHPTIAAGYHCDKHVVKMVLETTQILSTAQHLVNGEYKPYKPTHASHPCVLWAAETRTNYLWLIQLGLALAKEYHNRYGKTHACLEHLNKLFFKTPKELSFPASGATPPAQCMPAQYCQADPVEAYRAYYIGEKAHFARWDKLGVYPDWWPVELSLTELPPPKEEGDVYA